MRSVLGKACIERGLQPFLVEVNQRLADQFFSIRRDVMKKCKKNISWKLEPGVFTRDLEDLIKLLIELRGFDPEEADVQFGFDDGQGFLKLMMLVMQKPEHSVNFPRGVVHRVEKGWGLTNVAVVLLNGLIW